MVCITKTEVTAHPVKIVDITLYQIQVRIGDFDASSYKLLLAFI